MKYWMRQLFRDDLFEKNHKTAYHANQVVLQAILLGGIISMAVLAIGSICVTRAPGTWFYHALAALLFFLAMYGGTLLLRGRLVYWVGYLLYFAFVGFCIYTSAFLWPNDICIMMSAGLFVFPTFYLDKSWRVTLMTMLSSLLYIWVISIYKAPFCLRNELVSVICFTVIGCIAGASVRKMKLENIEHEEEERQNAQRDGMTGAYNRKTVEAMVEQRLSHHLGGSSALLLIDIDNLKTINDTFGHPQGDIAIRGMVAALRKGLRQSDLIGRIGGDEFIVFLEECGSEEQLREIAGRLMEEIAQVQVSENEGQPVTVSIGIAVRRPSDRSFDDLYHRADTALYKAKQSGRNQYSF